MNDTTAKELARQRMREIGKTPEEYHIDLVQVVGTFRERIEGRIEVKAYNQIYWLINWQNYYGLEIRSDEGGYWNSFDFSNNTTEEFKGLITIQKLSPDALWSISDDSGAGPTRPVEFVRVTIF